ncbi:uncharacterized protein LOC127876105 isoform X2 [Dreissena polymorpha]|uniref:Uncharacterized protein n=2 Tax=Dreissena polymorpha TaxID=45954 RepID=A0A9D4QLN6_DREPO|nr:uncharacterized protein LOC127876105 isoform X2 [Dreissena polymorpha]XP_052276993.1 uncharacterized protein LOC127876105 isoform X2 [Dreissena polymorpha]XP_052276994.1 uncharacterized protein LOC127876105 isoform X2 [Dreissena polymorpha]KAH3834750.1 hypothetical protein DPMN_108085 [Dreissena polymorpha]
MVTALKRRWRPFIALLLGGTTLLVLHTAFRGEPIIVSEKTWVDFPVKYSSSGSSSLTTSCTLKPSEDSQFLKVDLRVIVITYGRPQSLLRLLRSLDAANYDRDSVLIEVWIDRSSWGQVSNETLAAALGFRFKKGACHVHVHSVHVGISGQWLTTWNPASDTGEIAVIFEDDLTVSPYFYKYLKLVHNTYGRRSDVSGFSLQGISLRHSDGKCCVNVPFENKVFLYPTLGTSGFSPNRVNWFNFQSWLKRIRDKGLQAPLINDHISVKWYKELKRQSEGESMWELEYIYYTQMQKEYTLYPNFNGHRGLAMNWFEYGLHTAGQMEKSAIYELLADWSPEYEDLPTVPIYVNNNGDIIH